MERVRDQPLRPERMMASGVTAIEPSGLPSHAAVFEELVEAEQGEGWLARCASASSYLALNEQFAQALSTALRSLRRGPVLEICAGDGSLAAELRRRKVDVIATDVDPSGGDHPVEPCGVHEALRRYDARVVLASFAPVDAGIDRLVLETAQVHHYVVLNAWLGGEYGSSSLWTYPGWTRTPLTEVTRWMISRHDAWIGADRPVLTRGEAWLLSRIGPARHTTN